MSLVYYLAILEKAVSKIIFGMVGTLETPQASLNSNIQDLQKDVLYLLQDISKLMGRAKQELGNDNNSEGKYGEAKQAIDEAIINVENLELRMAIVAPMKAGKSTIINAIVGQDLLPSRNAAMTTIPTKISLSHTVEKPILVLSENTLNIFRDTWLELQQKIQSWDISEIAAKISQYPHLLKLAKEIKQDSFYIPSEVIGKDNISLVLTKLNDIVRLCCTIDPGNNPLDKLLDVPEIKTPCWRNENSNQSEQLGNLVIVDTPGPNEAGEHLRLNAVVEQELRRCSIVLIVLDFTQLNNQAAAGVKEQVQPIIDLIRKENLYVLVNKVDQRCKGDMTPEDVKKFIYSDLNLSEAEDSDRIFEISARQAFSATKFLLELQQYPEIELSDMASIEALAKEVLGNRWERKLQKQTKEDLQEEAAYLWEDSGFDEFILDSIQALISSAAPKCMLSAINRSYSLLSSFKDELNLRSSAIYQDAETLEAEIKALTADLEHLELCRSRLKVVDEIKAKLQANLNKILEELKKEAKISVKSHFREEDDKRAEPINKATRELRRWSSETLNKISQKTPMGSDFFTKIKETIKYEEKQVLDFSSKHDAEKFSNEVISWSKQRANNLFSQARNYTEQEIAISKNKLLRSLEVETRDILEKARYRLEKAFDIKLSFPPQPNMDNQIGNININVNSATREVTDYKTETYRVWYTLWIMKKQRQVPITKSESYYTVSVKEIVNEFNKSLEPTIQNLNSEIIKYLDIDFKQSIDNYFTELDGYLDNYRNSLKQSQKDRQLSIKKKEQLVASLKYLIPEAEKQLNQAANYQTKIQNI